MSHAICGAILITGRTCDELSHSSLQSCGLGGVRDMARGDMEMGKAEVGGHFCVPPVNLT